MSLSESFDQDVEEAKENLLKKEFFILQPEVAFSRVVTSPPTSASTMTTTTTTTEIATNENLEISSDSPIDFTVPNGKHFLFQIHQH
jgi:hypothetical protein